MAGATLNLESDDPLLEELCDVNTAEIELGRQTFLRLWNDHNFSVKTFHQSIIQSHSRSGSRAETAMQHLAGFFGDPREDAETIRASHEDICKFNSVGDIGYSALARTLSAFIAKEEEGTWYHRNGPEKDKVLWVNAPPGCGKTVLLRSLQDKVEREWGSAGASFIWASTESCDASIASLPGDPVSNPTVVYRSLLAQLFPQDANLRKALWALIQEPRADSRAFDDTQITSFFSEYCANQKIETSSKRTFIFVEIADDACATYVQELVTHLARLARNSDFTICVTSGCHREAIENENVISIPLHQQNYDDILLYVNLHLVTDWEEGNRTAVKIAEKASGVFLWAEIVVNILNEAIIEGATQEMIEFVLEEAPGDLHGLYERMLSTLEGQEQAEALTIFQWVMLAAEPMCLDDLALAVRLTDPNAFTLYKKHGALMAFNLPHPPQSTPSAPSPSSTPTPPNSTTGSAPAPHVVNVPFAGQARTGISAADSAAIRALKAHRLATCRDPANDIGRQLAKEGKFVESRGPKAKNRDRFRVNVVSKELCDDIINYIKPTLARHQGCDLVDIFPGVGLWSTALRDALNPRSHVMLEPDEEFYKPYLAPLLARPGTKLLPESGIVWEQLHRVLNSGLLPHQVERKYKPDEEVPRNDTLLVSINLSMFPKRKFRTFESLTQLVLFQFIASVRPGALFQRYGRVRLLVWMTDQEKSSIVPRTIQRRRKMAIESELATEYVCEIASPDSADSYAPVTQLNYRRDQALDYESTKRTMERMKQGGFTIPEGRVPEHVVQFATLNEAKLAEGISLDRPKYEEFAKLEALDAAGRIERDTPAWVRHKTLKHWVAWMRKRNTIIQDMIDEHGVVANAYRAAGTDEAARAAAWAHGEDWSIRADGLENSIRTDLLLAHDNAHLVRQDPPLMNWDRRWVEPLRVRPDEFYPRVPCSLLDIQPKSAARILRDMGPHSTRGGDTFDLIFKNLMKHPNEPVAKVLDKLYAGAADGIFPNCPSLVDPALGGSPMRGTGGLTPRSIGEAQFVDIAKAWMKWPFAPTYTELVSRSMDDLTDDTVEDPMGNQSGMQDGTL
ncbi:hypothetical protein N0V88_006191 [Collariella sp. IMI 366227]|nr:hypothetical protein N0V88_006191 [Collariella sp. IMI 366227]